MNFSKMKYEWKIPALEFFFYFQKILAFPQLHDTACTACNYSVMTGSKGEVDKVLE